MNSKQVSFSIVALKIGIAFLLTACGASPNGPLASNESIQSVGPGFAPIHESVCNLPIVGSFTNLGNGDTVQVSDDHGDCAIVIHCDGGAVYGHIVEAVGNDADWGNYTMYADFARGNIELMACGFTNSVVDYNGVDYFKEHTQLNFVNNAWLGYVTPNEFDAPSGNTWSKQQ